MKLKTLKKKAAAGPENFLLSIRINTRSWKNRDFILRLNNNVFRHENLFTISFTKETNSFYILNKTKELLKFVPDLKTKICIQQI